MGIHDCVRSIPHLHPSSHLNREPHRYNRVNGIHMGENPILKEVLREEWKSDAMVMSDWFGTYSLSESINAGSDLEMPGVGKWRTRELMMRALRSKKITERTVRERARKVLGLVQKCARGAPEVRSKLFIHGLS